MISTEVFVAKAEEIAAEDPQYQHGHDGSGGYCDCIGLVIGAIRRAGGQWRGIKGSNYAARNEVEKLNPIISNSELSIGEAVFKAFEPSQSGYSLPEKYKPGGEYYNGDTKDYYHIGIVESIYPLRIRHMTIPKCKMDTSIGKWGYHGKLKKIAYQEETNKEKEGKPMEKVIISGGEVSSPIHMRRAASTNSKIVDDIPQGSEAFLIEGGGIWNQIQYGKNTGYVMSIFVHKQGTAEGDIVTVSRAKLEAIYDEIGDLLGLRG